ncbi:Virulence-related outer membrane protein (plasmid) [Sodalis praecaptivus]|uniref:Virulence-related outer membrane protein n=1 Tax=Sodalis praecaptivus TaxID=1239307 RepID=W0I4C8_9GAMM|nr:Ail/Lom family outer membrane beta-barrel protein [Sodalis praecaptivus]AHF79273.1 Virulence-related outer membrane protein [Sodalis praecaptivus]
MNDKVKLPFLCAVLLFPLFASAENHSISVGYMWSNIGLGSGNEPNGNEQDIIERNLPKLNGFNIKYRYEWDSPLSLIGSLSYSTGSSSIPINGQVNHLETGPSNPHKINVDYSVKKFSLLTGPAYRVNDYISFYGLAGISHYKGDIDIKSSISAGNSSLDKNVNLNQSGTGLAYSVGVQINPMPNLVVDLSYEGSRNKIETKGEVPIFGDVKQSNAGNTNGFVVGIGYRF